MVKRHGSVVIGLFVASLFILSGCASAGGSQELPTAPVLADTPQPTPEPVSGEMAGLANPASVYCEEQGGRVELRDSDAGQYGVCIFADGQECEEWAFYRGECVIGLADDPDIASPEALPEFPESVSEPAMGSREAVGVCIPPLFEVEWIGTISSMPAGGQFDDYFQVMDRGDWSTGIDSREDDIRAQLAALRDTGDVVRVWGVLHVDVPDAYGSQIEVGRLEVVSSGTEVEWIGVIVSTPADSQFDDYFQMWDYSGTRVGVDALDDVARTQVDELRDSGVVVHAWGVFYKDVPDFNAAQIQVTRLEVASLETGDECVGTVVSMPEDAQFDNYFQMMDQNGTRVGIGGLDGDIEEQIVELRDTGTIIHVWGIIHKGIPDVNGLQIEVNRLEIE